MEYLCSQYSTGAQIAEGGVLISPLAHSDEVMSLRLRLAPANVLHVFASRFARSRSFAIDDIILYPERKISGYRIHPIFPLYNSFRNKRFGEA